jgi:di/tricarboxylate transporter
MINILFIMCVVILLRHALREKGKQEGIGDELLNGFGKLTYIMLIPVLLVLFFAVVAIVLFVHQSP